MERATEKNQGTTRDEVLKEDLSNKASFEQRPEGKGRVLASSASPAPALSVAQQALFKVCVEWMVAEVSGAEGLKDEAAFSNGILPSPSTLHSTCSISFDPVDGGIEGGRAVIIPMPFRRWRNQRARALSRTRIALLVSRSPNTPASAQATHPESNRVSLWILKLLITHWKEGTETL